MIRFTEDILRVIVQGEQGDIRLLGSDRIRYGVYDGRLPSLRRKYSVVYLLNTDLSGDALARLWVRGRMTQEFTVPAGDMRLAYQCGEVLFLPEKKCVDLSAWRISQSKHSIKLFSACDQEVEVHNVGKRKVSVSLNGLRCACPPGERRLINLKKRVDPKRKEFFAADFLQEPDVRFVLSGMLLC